jgi:glycine/D-amino acid oxidase-like deaminating enzyme
LIVHQYGHGGCGVTISFGTAEIACELVAAQANDFQPVAVLGAGVVGLVTARMLAQRGQRVTIYADRVAHETTSVLAGALWLPVGVEFGEGQAAADRKTRILRDSIDAFRTLNPDRYAVEELEIYEPAGSHTEEGLFAPGLIEKPEPVNDFPFVCDAQPGRRFRTLFIHTPQFLNALLEDLRELGVSIVPRRFETLDSLALIPESVVVNCLAMGSAMLFDDPAVYPARGVLVHMKPQDLGYCVHDGYKYMFPRSDALVLGGCFQPDRRDDVPDDEMVREILDHHRRFFGSACGVG